MKCFACVLAYMLFTFVSCDTTNNNFNDRNRIEIESFNKKLSKIVCDYIAINSDIHSFVLITDIDLKRNNWDLKESKIFLLGPSYQRLFEWGEDGFIGYPSIIMKKDNSIVFVHSSADIGYNEGVHKCFYEKHQIPLPESINSYGMFLSKAIAINIARNDANIISNQADTLFLRKRVPFITPPLGIIVNSQESESCSQGGSPPKSQVRFK